MGVRKLETKSILKNTFCRKSNGNLISQLKILIQNQAVFSTLRSNNFFSPKIETTTCTSSYAHDQRAFDGMDVVVSIALVKKSTFFMVRFSSVALYYIRSFEVLFLFDQIFAVVEKLEARGGYA